MVDARGAVQRQNESEIGVPVGVVEAHLRRTEVVPGIDRIQWEVRWRGVSVCERESVCVCDSGGERCVIAMMMEWNSTSC